MFKKSWYILFAWVLGSFYFFLSSALIVSMFGPGATEAQTMKWMSEMMNAMHVSLMGWAMEENSVVIQLVIKTGSLVFPAIFAGAALGFLLKMRRGKQ